MAQEASERGEISRQAIALIAAFNADDRGFRFFSDFADTVADELVAERAMEMRMERYS